jgi:hypothetical protein
MFEVFKKYILQNAHLADQELDIIQSVCIHTNSAKNNSFSGKAKYAGIAVL